MGADPVGVTYAVSGPTRVALSGSRFAAVGPQVTVLAVVGVAGLAATVAARVLLDASDRHTLKGLALSLLVLGVAWRAADRWRERPALTIGSAGIAVEHPDLTGRVFLPLDDVAYVVCSPERVDRLLANARFPVLDSAGAVAGHLWGPHQRSSLAFLPTSASHWPTVAVVFRVPVDLPVRAGALRYPLSEYPSGAAFGMVLPVADMARVLGGLRRAGLPYGTALPAAHATGLLVAPA